MDYEKVFEDLYASALGDLIRERFVRDILSDLEPGPKPANWSQDEYDANAAWEADVAGWLRDNYL